MKRTFHSILASALTLMTLFAIQFNGKAFDMFVENMKNDPVDKRYCSGIVPMDYFGAVRNSHSELGLGGVYGDLLSWAVIESNFYNKK